MIIETGISAMGFDTRLLDGMVIFVEVVNAGSFTQAATNSGHSTSYISKKINNLESRLGVRLLQRTTRSLSLTPEGQAYFQQCQQIMDDAQQAQNMLSGTQAEPKGTLKISCPTSFAMARLQQIFSDFITQFPQVNIELDLSNRKVDVVAEGFDIVIRATRQLDDSSLICRKILESSSVVVAAPAYLKTMGIPNTVDELSRHQTITYSHLKQPNVWRFVNNKGVEETINVQSRILTNSAELEISLCLAGHGIMQMPRFNLNGEIERGDLVELLTDYKQPEVNVYLVYPSRKHMSAKVRSFIDFVSARLA